MSRSLRSRIPETVAPSTRVCVSINLSIYLSIYPAGGSLPMPSLPASTPLAQPTVARTRPFPLTPSYNGAHELKVRGISLA